MPATGPPCARVPGVLSSRGPGAPSPAGAWGGASVLHHVRRALPTPRLAAHVTHGSWTGRRPSPPPLIRGGALLAFDSTMHPPGTPPRPGPAAEKGGKPANRPAGLVEGGH